MKKRILSILLALALLCAILPATSLRASAATTSGTCGDNLTWSFDSSTGTLTIKGSGEMDDDYDVKAPWYGLRYSIKKVTIGNSVTSIGYGAFKDCTSLTNVTIGSSVTYIGDYAFCDCESLTSVTIPNSVTSIGVVTFSDCTSLTSVTIPNSVTSIGSYAFDSCYSLTNVTIGSSVTSIGDDAFRYCSSLTSVTIPDSVTSIGGYAFSGCTSLTSVSIPSSVTIILPYAFSGCESLTSVTIPDSVTVIGRGAFDRCRSDLVIYGVACSAAETYANDNNISFVALAAPKITTQPKSATVAIGQSVTFRVAATGGALSYQWQFKKSGATSWTNWSGKTEATLVVTAGSNNNGCRFRCVVKNSYGTVTSNAAQLTIPDAPPAIQTQPSNASAALGKTATFKVVATGSNLTYQWQYKRAGATSWTNWSGKTEATLVVTAGSNNNGCRFRCVVKNSYGTVISNAARLTITNAAPVIDTQPSNASASLGKTATFKVVAAGSGLSYQWQYKRAGSSSWTNWSGKTEATLVVTAGSNNDGCQYRCVVKNSYGSVTSNAATLTVVTKPTITTQPSNASCALGKTVTYKVVATGKSLSYQWQYKRAGATSWTDWSGKTSATLSVTAGSNNNGCRFRCVVKNIAGSVTSNAAQLTITNAKPAIQTQPSNASAALGKTATFKVVAAGSGLSYQWQYKRAGASSWTHWSGKTAATLTVTAGSNNNGCRYRCVVKNAYGTVTSSAATLTVK